MKCIINKVFYILGIISLIFILFSCETTKKDLKIQELTYYEKQQELRTKFGDPPPKGYQPIDPIPVAILPEIDETNRENRNFNILNSLPNEAVRLVIGKEDSTGNITFGPFTATAKIGSYVVILDYIKYKSSFLPIILNEGYAFTIRDKLAVDAKNGLISQDSIEDKYSNLLTEYLDSTPYWIRSYYLEFPDKPSNGFFIAREYNNYNTPIYIGIGVRMIASVTISDVTVDLGSLYGLAAAAQNGKLQGTLIVQTLGLSGENISPQIPLPSEINITTIQNAIQSLATIKSKIYDQKVAITPQIVAIDDNIGRSGSKEQIISGLNNMADSFSLFIQNISK